MNHRFGRAANAAEKQAGPSSAALALAVGLALSCWGSASMAGAPIPDVDVKLGKNPGGIVASSRTDNQGNFHFDKLPAGEYKLPVDGKLSQSVLVGNGGKINGNLARGSDGTIGIAVERQQRLINNSEKATATVDARTPSADWSTPVNGIGGTGGGRYTFKPTNSANAETSNRDHIDQDAQTDIKKRTAVQPGGPGNVRLRVPADVSTLRGDERDVKLGTVAMANEPLTDGLMILRKNSGGITISAPTGADTEGIRPILDVDGNSSTDPIVAAPKGGDGKLPSILRVINNSETDTATVDLRTPSADQSTPVNGIGGQGGGRFTVKPTNAANAETSNRDHIDQDAQTDIKKGTAVQTGDSGSERIRVSADVATLRGTAPRPDGGDGALPGLTGQRMAGIDVKLGSPGGGMATATINQSGAIVAAEAIVASSKTDNQGNFHFDKLPAGNYKVIIPGLPAQAFTVGSDGIAGGTVMKGSDGRMSIFDRWGNRPETASRDSGAKAAGNPVIGFGSGNPMGAGPGGMGPGGGMLPRTAGPAMGGAGPMGGGGPAMGGAGSAMRPR